MKNSRLLLLMCAVATLDWIMVKVSLKSSEYKMTSQVKKQKGSKQ